MKPNSTSGAGHHNPTGVPTGLDRKARRAVHAARRIVRDRYVNRADKVLPKADSLLHNWTDEKLTEYRVVRLVNDAFRQIRNQETGGR